MPVFHALPGVLPVSDADLTIPRARQLLAAVRRNKDFSLVALMQAAAGPSGGASESLIVDVVTDGVPEVNRHGILFRERIALCVHTDAKKLVEVLALRKGFPVMLHQNQGSRGGPASLCLYFEPPPAVYRTWTAQNFLRRIQWWLEASARDELHPADQAVEGLFFSARSELVLPWASWEAPWQHDGRLELFRGVVRPGSGDTYFLERSEVPSSRPALAYVQIDLPPVTQGVVEQESGQLGVLADVLEGRGIDLLAALRSPLQARVGQAGVPIANDDRMCVVLMHVPMRRSDNAQAERIISRAYAISAGYVKVGLGIGALIQHEGKAYSGAGVAPAVGPDWRELEVCPMEVLHRVDAKAARQFSGITDDGPTAALVGAGSLGSTALNLWVRSGWGSWKVVDKDHVKPHNLVRHIAGAAHIGTYKSEVLAGVYSKGSLGTSSVASVVGEACDDAVAAGLRECALVVDATAGLEYPRYASTRDDLPRHGSMFISPSGDSAVLLVEDAARTKRLRTLEAQYYRAIINEPWGARHLSGHLGSFWSGASCRDISVVLPYSRIVAHAATLAEQVRVATQDTGASIGIWHRDPATAEVRATKIAPAGERVFEVGMLNCYMDDALAAKVQGMRQQGLPCETGGVLLGFYDLNVQAIVLVDALPAPPDSVSSEHGFERGTVGLVEAVTEASRRTAGIVGYVGEWHSHPRGCSIRPSGDDMLQLMDLTLGMAADGLPVIQLIAGDSGVSVMQGVVL